MNDELSIEVCVDSPESAVAAEQGGAKRVELCACLDQGGLTPSAGMIATIRQKVSIRLHVMIRPRPGDFCYSADEVLAMRRDVLMAKQLGADGVVFGFLDAEGEVERNRTGQLVELAKPLSTTYHRAFDMSADLGRSLEHVVEAGADRILTSGGAQTALQGAATLRELVALAAGRATIMACGGIDVQNVREIIEKTGAREIHVGLRTAVESPMRHRNEKISMGTTRDSEYQRFLVRRDNVEQLVLAASAHRPVH
jgi:copper homeostasis protein